MANIPVEHKSGPGIWPWLLGLLALLLVGWFVLELFDEEPDADELAGLENNVGIIDDVELDAPDLEPITLQDELYEDYGATVYADATTGQDARVGRSVDLDGARVLSVVGDSAFFVGADDNRRVLVVLENLGESATGAGGSDGVFNIDAGEMVSIDGTVNRYVEGARGTWELPTSERERMLQKGLYVSVSDASNLSVSSAEAN